MPVCPPINMSKGLIVYIIQENDTKPPAKQYKQERTLFVIVNPMTEKKIACSKGKQLSFIYL